MSTASELSGNECCIFQNMDVGGTDFERRLLCIKRELIEPRHKKMTEGRLDKTKEPFSVRQKPFWDIFQTRTVSFALKMIKLIKFE